MKRILCLIIALLFILCGCGKTSIDFSKITTLPDETFSFQDDLQRFTEDPKLAKASGFVNTKKTEVKSFEQAIEIAAKECTVKYDTVYYAFDPEQQVWKISFGMGETVGGDQTVYMTTDGITMFVTLGE